MKYIKILAFLTASLFTLSCFAGCDIEEVHLNTSEDLREDLRNERLDRVNERIYVITDPKTGVQYLVYSEKVYNGGMGGITPRLNPDGTLMISTEDEPDTNLS